MAIETNKKVSSEPGASWTALENTRLAYERTLLAWVRTAISMITFGFSIYKFFEYMNELQGGKVKHLFTPRSFGMILISAGLFTLLMAIIEHRRSMKRLKEQLAGMHISIALVLAVWISALGILAFVGVFFRQ